MPTEPSGEVVRLGGAIDRVKVSLRFSGDDLDPDAVSTLLGCPPTKSYRKGDTLPSQRSQRVAPTGLWTLKGAEEDGGVLETQVSRLLDRIQYRHHRSRRKSLLMQTTFFNGTKISTDTILLNDMPIQAIEIVPISSIPNGDRLPGLLGFF